MSTRKKKYYEIDVSDIPLLEYTNIFLGNLTWINRGVHNSIAIYDLVVREKPAHWGFYIFDGLERFVDYLLAYGFDEDAISILTRMGLIDSPDSERFYRHFHFSGNVSALPEGSLFFPGEPIVRITAPLAEANLITAFALNAFGYPTRVLSKMARVKLASRDTIFIGGSLARLPGFEQGVWPLRGGLLFGSRGFSPFLFRKFGGLEPAGRVNVNANHAFIKSFPTEREAYRYIFDVIPEKGELFLVMVDTYGLHHGLEVFIGEMKKTKHFDAERFMVTIDSGDLAEQSRYIRKRLDAEGLQKVRIQAFSNLDEYKIDDLLRAGSPIDCFISATELINITDNPRFEAVYKMAELRHPNGTIEHKAKLAHGKTSLPGTKQVFRVYDKKGMMTEDVIGLADENIGEPLLREFVKSGKQTRAFEDLSGVRARIEKELRALPDEYKRTRDPKEYTVRVSDRLQKLFNEVKQQHG